ncbi:DinB family protein [Planococcus salinus]|uniref:Damage-inducible protein DinB n=1 Tax=Planococcus salinus TaxID=1848460 RepID=A0A3M8P4Z5_9BACL|nr:DinB family protein [Planococcus salinus]RNF38420.1 hypothetical protein EEX84_14445 [Planococcus salinus]
MMRDKQFSYHKWATLKCLEHVQAAGEELYTQEAANSFATIKDTVEHVIGVEKLWLDRMNGIGKPVFERFDVSTIDRAKEAFLLLHAEMELYFSSLSEQQWEERLRYKNMRGDDFEHSREEMLFTIVNHASYHRGQITSFLRQFGKAGIPLDYIYYQKQNR